MSEGKDYQITLTQGDMEELTTNLPDLDPVTGLLKIWETLINRSNQPPYNNPTTWKDYTEENPIPISHYHLPFNQVNQLINLQKEAHPRPESIILLWLQNGPSTFDL